MAVSTKALPGIVRAQAATGFNRAVYDFKKPRVADLSAITSAFEMRFSGLWMLEFLQYRKAVEL
jgi:hypothetical protein